jgi:hypothetical protein
VLIAVASAKHKGPFAKVKRTAQLLALRTLLGHRQGIELSSVESLTDSEQIRISKVREQRISLSRFTSIQKEKVAGMVKSLPIVATWKDEDDQLFYVALGRVFEDKTDCAVDMLLLEGAFIQGFRAIPNLEVTNVKIDNNQLDFVSHFASCCIANPCRHYSFGATKNRVDNFQGNR